MWNMALTVQLDNILDLVALVLRRPARVSEALLAELGQGERHAGGGGGDGGGEGLVASPLPPGIPLVLA